MAGGQSLLFKVRVEDGQNLKPGRIVADDVDDSHLEALRQVPGEEGTRKVHAADARALWDPRVLW
jgi:predicted phosphatase